MCRPKNFPEPLTPEEIRRAKHFRDNKVRGTGQMCWDQVARHMNIGAHRLMAHFAPNELEQNRERRRLNAIAVKQRKSRAIQRGGNTKIVPPAALAERDRAYAADLTLNMTLCGDPLPGRSALDRR